MQILCSIKIEWHSSGFFENIEYRYVDVEGTGYIKQLYIYIELCVCVYTHVYIKNNEKCET